LVVLVVWVFTATDILYPFHLFNLLADVISIAYAKTKSKSSLLVCRLCQKK
jgi:hypothetical protein